MIRKIASVLTFLALAVGLALAPKPKSDRIYAQFVGASNVPGYAAAGSNAVINAAIGSALAVTNPASNFLILVQGGPIYCNSAQFEIGQSTIQLVASTTYLIVANCAQQTVYAKTAVTGPGSQGTNAINGPGFPAQILAPIAGLEIPIATVVCGNTNCGNTANGTITDNRPVANFPGAGHPLNTSTFANLPTTNVTDGTMILCSGCTTLTTGSATCTTGASPVLAVRVGGAWRCY